MTHHDDPAVFTRILQHLDRLAARLGPGSTEDHVRRSIGELAQLVAEGATVGPAVQRVLSSVRQLQDEELAGRRRHQQQSVASIARLLDTMQQELLPALQRSGRM